MTSSRTLTKAVLHIAGSSLFHSRQPFLVRAFASLVLGATLGLFACGGGGGDASSAFASSTGLFPLRIEADKRYLVDASGRPFLLHADTAWSLIAELSDADAERYLEDRRRKGFNAVIVNLLERKYATNAPRNFYGEAPFTVADDYGTPNEAYFAHVDGIIQRAAAKGILVLLVPSYLGNGGGDEGWYQAMLVNGAAKMRAYGRYLGRRYGSYSNILWVHGGDFDPPVGDKQLVREIALGIKEFDSRALHSVHCAAETSALDYWSGESWLQVNTIYTYVDVRSKSQTAYANPMPFFLFEGRYENESMPDGNEQHVRVQAYHALLSGATGEAFGNNPVWHFSGPGLFPTGSPTTWQGWLDSPGALSMVNVHSLFAALPWWTLRPDGSNSLLTAGHAGSGEPYDRAVAAKASDASFALVYLPSARAVTVDLSQLAGPRIKASWYDPASGATSEAVIAGSPFLASSGPRVLTPPPGNNTSTSGSFSDWVLVLESTP